MKDDIGFFAAVGKMWKNIFNYSDEASLKEYWFPVIFTIIIALVAFACFAIDYYLLNNNSFIVYLIGCIFAGYLSLSVIPGVALTVRRLHGTGRKGWWTLLLLLVIIGTIIVMWLCSFNVYRDNPSFFPWNNEVPSVYGPPEWFEKENPENDRPDLEEFDPDNNMEGCVYGPPEWFENPDPDNEVTGGFNPDENDPVDVYGPPPFEDEDITEPVIGEFDPEENYPEVVYGPPEWFENPDPDNEVTGGFNPDENDPVDVYGPPEWFE